jgi:PncC family amidohydrolase
MDSAFVVYSNRAKSRLLNVDPALIERFGAVSGPVARAMAAGARRRARADIAVSNTGVAGPGGGSNAKPVGTTWIGVSYGSATRSKRYRLPGDRAEVRSRAAQAALLRLWELLESGSIG